MLFTDPTSAEIRLVHGDNSREGRVEIRHDGKWGTVCLYDFGEAEAKVVCRELGLPYDDALAHYGQFAGGTGLIWLNDVACNGSENHLSECGHGGWGNNNCWHTEDVGVICQGTQVTILAKGVLFLYLSLFLFLFGCLCLLSCACSCSGS